MRYITGVVAEQYPALAPPYVVFILRRDVLAYLFLSPLFKERLSLVLVFTLLIH